MELATAINNRAVNDSCVMSCLSSSTLTNTIMIKALVCRNQPMTAPDRKAPTMKCNPDQSAPKAHIASQMRPTYQRSFAGSRTK